MRSSISLLYRQTHIITVKLIMFNNHTLYLFQLLMCSKLNSTYKEDKIINSIQILMSKHPTRAIAMIDSHDEVANYFSVSLINFFFIYVSTDKFLSPKHLNFSLRSCASMKNSFQGIFYPNIPIFLLV